jgi:hypothetical protein
MLNPDIVERLSHNAEVETECGKIMDSLEEEECADLRHIARGQAPSPEGRHRLQRRGLVVERPGRPAEIFSPVFERFLRANPGSTTPPPASTFRADFSGTGPPRINDLPVPMSIIERELLRHLYTQRPRPCPKNELADVMIRAEAHDLSEHQVHGHTMKRLEKYFERLRAKLGPERAAHLHHSDTHYWLTE